jgi:glycosyltransferase involved in cell wall biosynthesis
LAQLPAGRQVVIDGLALGGMPALVAHEAERLRLIALIHHPLALESGLSEARIRQLRAAERRALALVPRVIVTSPTTAQALADYAVAPERITVVPPGTDPAPLARGSGGRELHLLCVATLTPRKGHALLIEALAGLRDRAWRLDCVGSRTRDPDTAATLQRQIAATGLQQRIRLRGELSQEALQQAYRQADAFVLASHYEGFGMVLTEAMAHGLPIVATGGGAVPQTVPANAALLVPPGDGEALRHALASLIDDPGIRAGLHRGAQQARQRLPDWRVAGERFAAAIARAAGA